MSEEDEKRTRLKASARAVTAALLQVLDGVECEDVAVVLAQRIERTARALRDLRPVAKAVEPKSPDGQCVCGHNEAAHESPDAGRQRGCLFRVVSETGFFCKCLDYAPLPF